MNGRCNIFDKFWKLFEDSIFVNQRIGVNVIATADTDHHGVSLFFILEEGRPTDSICSAASAFRKVSNAGGRMESDS